MKPKSPLAIPKKRYNHIIRKIATASSSVGIDAQYTHAVVITYLERITQRLDKIEKKINSQT